MPGSVLIVVMGHIEMILGLGRKRGRREGRCERATCIRLNAVISAWRFFIGGDPVR